VEAAGIEPASEDVSIKMPSCFSCILLSPPPSPTGRL